MRCLLIDTTSAVASIAIATEEALQAESQFESRKTLSIRLVSEIEQLLERASCSYDDLDLFAVANGPGSFTGVRAGVATMHGLALAAGKPCIGVSSLAILASQFPMTPVPVCPMIDARKNEVYAALYDCCQAIPSLLVPDCVATPEWFAAQLAITPHEAILFAGEGALMYRDVINHALGSRAQFAPEPVNGWRAAHAAPLVFKAYRSGGGNDATLVQPVYLRPTEAEYAKINRK